ncbi:beta-glucosidase 47 [Euphorbia peplus]|nr:beta-glucosidase 47 [Euphorbia peplus]
MEFWFVHYVAFCFSFVLASCSSIALPKNPISRGFLFGTASSSYQFEGAYLSHGKGLNNWDTFTHNNPGKIYDRTNGDVAVDQYHLYLEDMDLMKSIGVNSYRFSISWARILPKGRFGKVNKDGIYHYNNFINALLLKGIQPFVTLTHYDIPQELEDRYGSWLSPKIQEDFKHYAEICFRAFGDRVKYWTTFNEPNVAVIRGYRSGLFPPSRCSVSFGNCSVGNSETEPFIAAHNMILSHAAAVDVYRTKYQNQQGGKIGLVMSAVWYEPMNSSFEDIQATERAQAFYMNWFLDPIILGSYPKQMHEILGEDLPEFSKYDLEKLSSGLDFIGLNLYTGFYIKDCMFSFCNPGPGVTKTEGYTFRTAQKDGIFIGKPTTVDWLYVYPQGMEKIVTYVKERYNNTPMYITENGLGETEDCNTTTDNLLNDVERVEYMSSYLDALMVAIRKGADVRGYFAWSLLDNFEWLNGYKTRFGLHYVDYSTLKRTRKLSGTWYKDYISNHTASTTLHLTRIMNSLSFYGVVLLMGAILLPLSLSYHLKSVSDFPFPPNFLFGTASSAYQYEGAYLSDGKGLNNWDVFSHIPGKIIDGNTGDVAVDQYNRFREDIDLMVSLRLNTYRFSISWARILPKGRFGDVNLGGIRYYNELIDALLIKGIEPFVTITHFDLPQELEDRYKSFLSSESQKDFGYYADICFKYFGDRVKFWSTFNEPNLQAIYGYRSGLLPPSRCTSPFGNCTEGNSEKEPFIAAHNMILSHATAVQIYRTKYQKEQGGSIGIVIQCMWFEPISNSTEDKLASERAQSFFSNWFLDPIIFGKYPREMIDILGSTLPAFSSNDEEKLKMGLDFIGINHYTSNYVKDCLYSFCGNAKGSSKTEGFCLQTPFKNGVPIGKPTDSNLLYVYPKGMEKIVTYIKDRYNNVPMFITENGYVEANNPELSIEEALNDMRRVEYISSYLEALTNAMRKGADHEGAYLSDGKGKIIDGNTGDVAADQYHRFREDIDLMVSLGVNTYRFSISWARILPKGRFGDVNLAGIRYYNELIDALLLNGIQPFVTLAQFDLPQELEDRYKSFLSSESQEDFGYYANICFKNFGDRVKFWSTLNEPNIQAILGYRTGDFPPSRCSTPFGNCTEGNSETEPFVAAHNMILSHATAVQIYRTKYQKEQGGSIGMVVICTWFEPISDSVEDKLASERAQAFFSNWFLDPIIFGKYPKEMVEMLGSLLPEFSDNDQEKLKTGLDFIGINHYTSKYVKDCLYSFCENGLGSSKIEGYAEANNPKLSIEEAVDDVGRVEYISSYLEALTNAMR